MSHRYIILSEKYNLLNKPLLNVPGIEMGQEYPEYELSGYLQVTYSLDYVRSKNKLDMFDEFVHELDILESIGNCRLSYDVEEVKSVVCNKQSFKLFLINNLIKLICLEKYTNKEIDSLVVEFDSFRANKEYDKSDAIRKDLLSSGVMLETSKIGTTWRYGGWDPEKKKYV